MRFAPAAAALSLVLAVNASIGMASDHQPDPRAVMLVSEGQAALAAGETQAAIDAFEAALVVDPAHTAILLELAKVARSEGLQGKAIRYYREALDRDPNNFAAISGEGEAMVEKGALEKAKRNLSKLQSLCGEECPETLALQSTISVAAQSQLAVDTAQTDAPVAQN